MDRSPKRPRLSLFDGDPSGTELDTARHSNDMALKNRFESIFAKYSQDFTGIGDEVDIVTGEVVVNNGHLESMQTETDPGLDSRYGEFSSAGRSILRAMTAALDPSLPGPDDVLMSIETIAENAAFTNDMTSGESEDDLFDPPGATSRSMSQSYSQETEPNQLYTDIEPYNSDSDSLFEEDTRRSSSADTLFGIESGAQYDRSSGAHESKDSDDSSPPPANPAADDDQILARFGPNIGQEVLNLIGQRKQAHIEPIWRLPVQIDALQVRHATPTLPTYPSPDVSLEGSNKRSIWHAPAATKKRVRSERTSTSRTRAESLDPLQEDFPSGDEAGDISTHQSPEAHGQSDVEDEAEDDFVRELVTQIATTGNCPYCKGNFKNKSGVMAHWDRLLVRPPKQPAEDDPHDEELMRRVRSKALRRVRLPRLIVYDFRTMVELHEGAGMSFDDIVASKTLRSRKTSLKLQDIYNKHRTPPDHNDPSRTSQPWSKQEENTLAKLCQNPLSTIATLRRGLKGRDELEIGNHLADTWLSQLGNSQGRSQASGPLNEKVLESAPTDSVAMQQAHHRWSHEETDPVEVKREESEDELFTVS